MITFVFFFDIDVDRAYNNEEIENEKTRGLVWKKQLK
jgi:hypothetical protein